MEKKEIQRKRMMSIFIDAAAKILENEGIEAITIRKVANIAGYNSATLYNYFENIDHLVFFAAMGFIKEYAYNLEEYIKGAKNGIEKYKLIWECFCNYSFKKPEVYYAIFFARLNNSLEDYVTEYYKIFPEELGTHGENISTMLLKHNIYDRGKTSLEICVNEGYVKEEDMEEVNEMTLLLYQGILLKVINKKIDSAEARKRILKYIDQTLKAYRVK
ncbi:MAG: TetR/AcrR family transcriptional regulator [Firmicutes bacterium]|nr:TetR/AcrR family transcriptional regulator [Bacillota bacterium]